MTNLLVDMPLVYPIYLHCNVDSQTCGLLYKDTEMMQVKTNEAITLLFNCGKTGDSYLICFCNSWDSYTPMLTLFKIRSLSML